MSSYSSGAVVSTKKTRTQQITCIFCMLRSQCWEVGAVMICHILTLAAQHLNLTLRRNSLPFKSCWAAGHLSCEKLKTPDTDFPTSPAGRPGEPSQVFNCEVVTEEWKEREEVF